MSAYSRAEKAMETWKDRGLISPEGKAFLVASLDPFHDAQIENLAGYPDIETSPSLVRMIKQSITVTMPAFSPAPASWDMQVVVWPWSKRMPFVETSSRLNNLIQAINGPTQPIGGLQIFAVPSGTPFDLNGPGVVQAGCLELSDEILQGSNRLIGAGYEIHDTTA